MGMKRGWLLMGAMAVLLLAAGCGPDTMQIRMSWNYGDLDLAIQSPVGQVYTTQNQVTIDGYFGNDCRDGGTETFTLWPYVHSSGAYDIGVENFGGQSIPITVRIEHNGLTTTFDAWAEPGGRTWVYTRSGVRRVEQGTTSK